jgi:formate hydrogenlyase subunit 6/NADH:ubiquinone oxidoreductase subunit I
VSFFLPVLLRNLFKGPSTEAFPFGEASTPKRMRARMAFDPESCALCRVCTRVCPAGAIQFEKKPDGLEFNLWHNSCVFCGLCAHYCESEGLHATNDWHLSHPQSEKYALVERALVKFQKCSRCGKQKMPAPLPLMAKLYPGSTAAEIERLRAMCPQCRKAETAPPEGETP